MTKPRSTRPKKKRKRPTLDQMEAVETADWVQDKLAKARKRGQTAKNPPRNSKK